MKHNPADEAAIRALRGAWLSSPESPAKAKARRETAATKKQGNTKRGKK